VASVFFDRDSGGQLGEMRRDKVRLVRGMP